MNRHRWTIACLAYGIGLLSTGFLCFTRSSSFPLQWITVLGGLSLLTVIVAVIASRVWYRSPRWQFWLGIGLIAIFAVFYWQFRLPYLQNSDISHLATKKPLNVTVTGIVLNEEQQTQNQRLRFWLQAKTVQKQDSNNISKVTGKLYVTLPQSLIQSNDSAQKPKIITLWDCFNHRKIENSIYPGQRLTLEGILYQPSSPSNPGQFDFKTYLAREGGFAGLSVKKLRYSTDSPPFGWWQIRQCIVTIQQGWLSPTEGKLLSSIVLGQKAVDLPTELRNAFIQAGMAHILAASGFHVALLLGSVLFLTQRLSVQWQFSTGVATLLLYLGLSGGQPSILRAVLMGIGALVGILLDRKSDSLRALLLAGTLLLLWNPLWIQNLGFQLSFLATFGLIVTMQPLITFFDWLPPKIAGLIALPIAASVWTLPLLLYHFHVVAPYSIPLNAVTAPLVTIISLGGMISAIVGLIVPILGSIVAGLLHYPLILLINLVQFANDLPGSSYTTGSLSLGMMIGLYGLLILIWLHPWWRKRWRMGGLLIFALILFPIVLRNLTLVQVTVFDSQPPMIVIQNRGKTTVINTGDKQTRQYILEPFLTQQGIDSLDCIIDGAALTPRWLGCGHSSSAIGLKTFIEEIDNQNQYFRNFTLNQVLSFDSLQFRLLKTSPSVLQWELSGKKWTYLVNNEDFKAKNFKKIPSDVFLWNGKPIDTQWWQQVQPQTAIALSDYVTKRTRKQVLTRKIQLYVTGKNGAVQWNSPTDFTPFNKRHCR